MKKIAIADQIILYQFPPRTEAQHFGFNIYALIDPPDALLIDAAFADHASAVRDDLSAMGVEARQIVISHFHEDHFSGLRAFPKLQVHGSGAFQVPNESFAPTNTITEPSALSFGDFTLRFFPMPGHSVSDVITLINQRFVHVGDDLMSSNDGLPLLPSVEFGHIPDLIAALDKLKEFRHCTFLLGHGNPISGEADILDAIDNRLRYLEAVYRNPSRITYHDATQACRCQFLHAEWHELLYP